MASAHLQLKTLTTVAGKGEQKSLNVLLFASFQLILWEHTEKKIEDLVWNYVKVPDISEKKNLVACKISEIVGV